MYVVRSFLLYFKSLILNLCLFLLTRGKPSGHDVDILITHEDDNIIEGLLSKLVEKLEKLVSFRFPVR